MTNELREIVQHIKSNLDTRAEWNESDYQDFYQRDVVERLLPMADAYIALTDALAGISPAAVKLLVAACEAGAFGSRMESIGEKCRAALAAARETQT